MKWCGNCSQAISKLSALDLPSPIAELCEWDTKGGSERFKEIYRIFQTTKTHKTKSKRLQEQDERDMLSEAACHIVMIYCPLPSDLYNLCQQHGKQIAFRGLEMSVWERRQHDNDHRRLCQGSLCTALFEQKAQNTPFTFFFSLWKDKPRSSEGNIPK